MAQSVPTSFPTSLDPSMISALSSWAASATNNPTIASYVSQASSSLASMAQTNSALSSALSQASNAAHGNAGSTVRPVAAGVLAIAAAVGVGML
ncbi:hypothetical protein DM01DRAFT_1339873 [Hesseltinella vesiculosa]|uniref:Uncharacterized protein n=1 Tax=Hesseltinella vesiculosa TaxID=101127 RepID=A0A1X2G5Z6_9FUNG|nr:hypothetical protein DM01DRAFT_1339873 [Hesseltinella vesiculosa]